MLLGQCGWAVAIVIVMLAMACECLAAELSARDLIAQALAAAGQVEDRNAGMETLMAVARAQAVSGDIEGAKSAVASIPSAARRATVLSTAVASRVKAGDVAGAKSIADSSDAEGKQVLYVDIAIAQARQGDITEARITLRSVKDASWRGSGEAAIAGAQAKEGDIDDAMETAGAIPETAFDKVQAYCLIAEAQARGGNANAGRKTIALAQAGVEKLKTYLRPLALTYVAHAQVIAGDFDGAQATADASDKDIIEEQIAAAQAGMGDISGAKQTADALTDFSEKILAYTCVAKAQAKAGDTTSARSVLEAAKNMVGGIFDPHARALAIYEIAKVEAKVMGVSETAQWAGALAEPDSKAQGLAAVVAAMSGASDED